MGRDREPGRKDGPDGEVVDEGRQASEPRGQLCGDCERGREIVPGLRPACATFEAYAGTEAPMGDSLARA